MWDGQRIGGKVIDHAKSVEPQLLPQRFDREGPEMICERDLVACPW
jgi:hypothetical protein